MTLDLLIDAYHPANVFTALNTRYLNDLSETSNNELFKLKSLYVIQDGYDETFDDFEIDTDKIESICTDVLPTNIQNLRIVDLVIFNQPIKKLPEMIHRCLKLKRLSLHGTNIKRFPPFPIETHLLSRLTYLHVDTDFHFTKEEQAFINNRRPDLEIIRSDPIAPDNCTSSNLNTPESSPTPSPIRNRTRSKSRSRSRGGTRKKRRRRSRKE